MIASEDSANKFEELHARIDRVRELREQVRRGLRAVVVFCLARKAEGFDAAREVDAAFARELEQAALHGVEVLPVQMSIDVEPEEAADTYRMRYSLTGLVPWTPRKLDDEAVEAPRDKKRRKREKR